MLDVTADVGRIEAYSGHADYKEMIGFLKCQDPGQIKKTFIVHGEYTAQQFYKGELEKEGYKNITIPEMGEEVEI
jgi:metallo-beta-lactamase family protein